MLINISVHTNTHIKHETPILHHIQREVSILR